jgi:spore photoproduct lyase
MYTSANIVIFVNIEDIFKEVEDLLNKHPVYLCISYDTDILAFENITGFTEKWIKFAKIHKNLKIEIRTKSANFRSIEKLKPCDNVILAWTLSPEEISQKYEVNTPSFNSRLTSVSSAVSNGWKTRICFDPILYLKNWETYYKNCIERTFGVIFPDSIQDISIGVFRISKDYLKRMKKVNPYSVVLSYPFEIENGVCTYSDLHHKAMIDFVYSLVCRYIKKEKIFI